MPTQKLDPSEIYPTASEGRLKQTDDKSKSIHEEEKILYADVHDEKYKREEKRTKSLKTGDRIFSFFLYGTAMLGVFYFLARFIGNFFPFFGIARDVLSVIFGIIIVYSLIRLIKNIIGGMKKKL